MPLTENWRLISADEAQSACMHDAGCQCAGWMPAEVPSTVQAALVANGRAPSPWRDQQAAAFRKYENSTWIYRTVFELSPQDATADRFELRFEGISLFATVWLNGSPVGYTDNAHRTYTFDVTRRIVRHGKNVLAVECGLRMDEMRKRVREDIGATSDAVRSFMRLCQMSFGWDFAPRLLPTGLWRPVSLVCHTGTSIRDLAVHTQSISADSATLNITVEPVAVSPSATPATLRLAIRETADGPAVWQSEHTVASDAPISVPASVEKPRLWYPYPVGEPHLYHLEAQVERDGNVTGRRALRFGIRTIELKQDNQFTFSINGVDVFARGANWVPPNSLTLDTEPDQYRHLLDLAHAAHFNMLRVWGGGTYERDEFYELCDERGIMVWQDFMYACGMYPDDDPTFMESIQREAEDAVRRLRSHPCIVLWCGENECQDTWAGGYEWYKNATRHFGARIYEHVLPDTVAEFAPDVPWWPGSPFGGAATMSLTEGDFHDWYDLPNWRRYDASAPRFSSEYGFRSVPQRETVEEMISPEFQWDRYGFLHHVWDFHHGVCNWMKAVMPEFGIPESLDDFIMLSQEAQATLMRYAVEVYRRKMFGTSGSLIWQYNEPWPAVTFSLVDFFGRPKASYYWVARAHAPVLGMFYGDGANPSFWGISDRPHELAGTLRLRRFDNHDGLLVDETLDVRLNPNAATQMLPAMPEELRIAHTEREFLCAELWCGGHTSERIHHAAHRADWDLASAQIAARVEQSANGTLRLTLASDTYAHFVCVRSAVPKVRFSDNYVDLLPGEPRTIEIAGHDGSGLIVQAANAETARVAVDT